MNISQKGLNLIKKYEGCRLTAYKCPAGVWTIGYGHTATAQPGQTITQNRAEELLKADMVKYEGYVRKYVSLPLNQSQFDSLTSFCYNCGAGNLIKLVTGRTYQQIADAIPKYNKGDGKVLNGLVKRRKEERALFLSNTSNTTGKPVLRKGSKGESVKELQQLLSNKGYSLAIDGTFGSGTLEAVRAFQADNGLSVDGVVGPKTWEKLT